MNRRLITVAALTTAALFTLAGCGQATDATAADDPAPTAQSAGGGESASPDATTTSATAGDTDTSAGDSSGLDPSLAQWPATGCASRAVVSIDYGRMPQGYKTPEEAVAHAPSSDIPAGVAAMAPAGAQSAKGPAAVWIVDPDTNEIQAQVSLFQGPDGWFVDGVMTCS